MRLVAIVGLALALAGAAQAQKTESGLEGGCSWVLGEEDPAVWGTVPSRR